MKILLIFSLLFCFSCSKINLLYEKRQVQKELTKTRIQFYQESFGEISDPERDYE